MHFTLAESLTTFLVERFKHDNQTRVRTTGTPASLEDAADEEKVEKDVQINLTVVPVQDEEEERFEWREVWRGEYLCQLILDPSLLSNSQELPTSRPG